MCMISERGNIKRVVTAFTIFRSFQTQLQLHSYLPSLLLETNQPTMAPDIPKTCRAVVIEKPGAPWAIKDVPVEQPKSGEVLIKVHACGVCHSDSFLQQGAFGEGASFPRIPGHEVIGTVVAIGDGEKKWKVGDRVGGPWHGAHDGTCKSCNRGLFQMCDNELVNGVTRNGGCMYTPGIYFND
jgi:hypothetical protein